MLLMAAGVGVFGALSGVAAAWFLSPAVKESESDLTRIEKQLESMRKQLDQITTRPADVG